MCARGLSNQIEIATPCQEDWNSMIGNDRIRFCHHCQLSVHDISEMNRKQLRKLISQSKERLCVRYEEPVFEKKHPPLLLHRIGRRTSKIAAGAFSASLSLSNAMASASGPGVERAEWQPPTAVAAFATFTSTGGAELTGVVFDPNGAVIQGAHVTLVNVETKDELISFSDGSGTYKFENLPAGTFNLKIQATGFADSDVPFITLRQSDQNRIDQTLSIAAFREEVDVVGERMVTMGAGVVVLPDNVLVKAAYADDLEAMRQVLLEKPDVNVRDERTGSTALEQAVHNSNREMIQLLLWARADVNLKDSSGQTVLMMMGEQSTSEIVWDLLNAGAKINARDNDGETALMAAAQVNNVDVLKTLLDAGAKVNGSNNEGVTTLMLAAASGLVNNVRALLLAGAEINVRDKKGRTALMHAEKDGNQATVRLLKSFGAVEFPEPNKDQD